MTRWQLPPASLTTTDNSPNTFVIIGLTRLKIDEKEAEQILKWVSFGGKLVIIDREPSKVLLSSTANWAIKNTPISSLDIFNDIDPGNQLQMTAETPAFKPTQPSVFTANINAVQPSRFASSVSAEYFGAESFTMKPKPIGTPFSNSNNHQDQPPIKMTTENSHEVPAKNIVVSDDEDFATPALNSPFVHLANGDKNILIDFPYGSGQIVYLTDPYIVSNAGLKLVDNAQLAANIVSADGVIAFDEFHQGYGANTGSIFAYFAGTPVLAILLQFVLLIGVLFWSQSRRFARPLPSDEPSRLSKLEYISAMAELQQKTKAYDLALENIYTEFRRSVAKLLAIDSFSAIKKDIATLIAERVNEDASVIYSNLQECQDLIHSASPNKKRVLELAAYLRSLENKLGLKRSRKQAFRK